MTLIRLALPGALLIAAGAAHAATTVPLIRGGTTDPQTSVAAIGGDSITNLEFDVEVGPDANDADDEDAGPLQVEGRSASINRGVMSFRGWARDAGDSRRAARNSALLRSFTGVNFFDQRFSNKGNQFSVEPPDQALCVGAGFVVESVNDVMRIFDTSGDLVVGPVDLNTFYGYPAAINRGVAPNTFGPSITDPICLFDQDTQRFFHVVLTLDRAVPTSQALNGKNHLDIAVSNSSNPAGSWTTFKLPVQNDGTDGTPDHGCVQRVPATPPATGTALVHGPCLGDYPHIGADRNAIFLTTNEFNLAAPGFKGAQIYAISKRALAAATRPNAVLFDTRDFRDSANLPGFTVWPAQSPSRGDFENDNHGTAFLLSSDAVFSNDGTSTELVVWSVTNTRSIDLATPALALSRKAVTVGKYGVPPKANQKAGDAPLRECVADPGCFARVTTARRDNPLANLDSNDSRMQQVSLAKGLLWGALDTAVSVGGATKAGIAFFVLDPRNGRISTQGTIAVAGNNVTYPAIGVTRDGRGVIAFTLVGADHFPSAAFVGLDSRAGAGPIHVAAEGLGPQDGFTGYPPLVASPPRPRWGDYGAAATDGDTVWISSEFVAQTCNLAAYLAAPFGTCGNTRGSLGNWATRVSQVRPGEADDD